MTTVRVLRIDPETCMVTEHDWKDGDLAQIHAWVGTDCLDHATQRLPDGRIVLCWVDDIGLSKPKLKSWYCPQFYPGVLVGAGVMLGGDAEGETIDCPYRAEDLHVMWEVPMAPLDPDKFFVKPTEPSAYVIRLLSLESDAYMGERAPPYPVWLKSFDVDANNGYGDARITKDKAQAMRFADMAAAMRAWQTQSSVRPLRPDGRPNRPLTAFTCEIEPA